MIQMLDCLNSIPISNCGIDLQNQLLSSVSSIVFLKFSLIKSHYKELSQRAWMHLRCISETSYAASQRRLKEG